MPTDSSVTHWIEQLKAGDPAAAQKLWERYFQQLVSLARAQLQRRGTPRREADEEDVALSAFETFCRRAEEGRFPQLGDRDGLWRLLVTITIRKAINLNKKVQRRPENARAAGATSCLEQVLDEEPTPEFAALVSEEYQRLFGLLKLREPEETARLQAVALLDLQGYTAAEIARQVGRSTRTVERKLQLIRQLWGQEDVA